MELDASIFLDRRLLAVANALPLVDSLLHLFETCHAFTQRLASQHRQFTQPYSTNSHAPAWNEFLAFAILAAGNVSYNDSAC